MIISEFSNKEVTAAQRAKQRILTVLDIAYFFDDTDMTKKEKDLVNRYITELKNTLDSALNGNALYRL